MQPAFVSAAKIAATLTPALRATDGVITITGIGDHLRPEWPITITGMRIPAFGTSKPEVVRRLPRAVQKMCEPLHTAAIFQVGAATGRSRPKLLCEGSF